MSEIRPALSAKQWDKATRHEVELPGGAWIGPDKDGTLEVSDGDYGVVWLKGGDRHALAALALHGQPFGFTWEDVDWLRNEVAQLHYRADDLADRIAALLPPRTPTDSPE